MLASDIIARVRATAGDTDILQFTDATILTWINDATRECASNNNLLQKTGTSNTVAGTQSYPIPADILRLHSVRYNKEKLDILSMSEFDKFVDDYASSQQGTPLVCYLWATNLTLYPIPDSVKVLTIEYTRTPVDVTLVGNTPDLPVMYHRRLVDYCLAMVAEQDDDMNRYQIKMQEFSDGVQRLRDDQESELDEYPGISVSSRDGGGVAWEDD